MTLRKLAIALLLLCMPLALNAQAHTRKKDVPSPKNEMAAARKFAQAFYDWYAPMAVKEASFDAVLQRKPNPLSPELAKALKEYFAAEAKSNGELVGLDFDPFLNSQDPVAGYKVESIKKDGAQYLVGVKSVPPEGSSDTTSVVAVVAKRSGKWAFTNFRYPEGSDLLKELKSLKERGGKPGG